MTALRLVVEVSDRLPGLAWCARMSAGSPEVHVRVGAGVETRADAFAEAAWDGAFADFRFDQAAAVAGSGGRVFSDHVLFVGSTGRQDRLYVVRAGAELFVSNSPVFALVEAGDEPDPAYRGYFLDLAWRARDAVSRPFRVLRMRRHVLELHEIDNLRVERDLSFRRVPKPELPAPASYAEYTSMLEGVLARTFANALDSARRRSFRPLATLSRGYDCSAVAVLAARAGCREALTFAELAPGVPSSDDGTEIGARLGLQVLRRARDGWRLRHDMPEAEGWASPPGTALSLASIEEELSGRLLLSGRFGDLLFEIGEPDEQASGMRLSPLAAPSQIELRLRVGFLNLAPLFVSWCQLSAVRGLAALPEMAQYRVGGSYDRPLPRRLLEEAGVPRELFGRTKAAGAFAYAMEERDLTPPSRSDFRDFLANGPPVLGLRGRERAARWLSKGRAVARARLGSQMQRVGLTWPDRGDLMAGLHEARLYHWGFARTKHRYLP